MNEDSESKSGRPPFAPTSEMRLKVMEGVAFGMTQADLARAVGCTAVTLRKHFQEELDTGGARMRLANIHLLFISAREGSVSAQKEVNLKTSLIEAMASFESQPEEKPAKLGKKEVAAQTAITAGVGTDWGSDLNPEGRPN